MLEIKSNGSKWAGESPDPLSKLFEMLATHPLDKRHDDGDCFMTRAHGGEPIYDGLRVVDISDTGPIYPEHPHAVHFAGNFRTYAHGFSIYTDDAEVIEVLRDAIKANMQRADYVAQSPNPYKAGREAASRGLSLGAMPAGLTARDISAWKAGWSYVKWRAELEAAGSEA